MAARKTNYRYWASLDKWNQKETALLMCGLNPDEHRNIRLTSKDLPEKYAQAADIARALKRVDWQKRYGAPEYEVSGDPMFAVDALLSAGWDAPDELKDALTDRAEREKKLEQNRHSRNERANDDTETNMSRVTRERKTMLKLIFGLACGGYGLQPDDEKNRHAKSMRVDCEKIGMPLDDGTIKKYLDEARALYRNMAARAGHKKV